MVKVPWYASVHSSDALRQRWPLDYWDSEEWLDAQDKLDWLESCCITYNPRRADILRALDITWLDRTNVLLMGQDPYPDPRYATGVAFSSCRGLNSEGIVIPSPYGEGNQIPASLKTLLWEYTRDLSLPWPSSGCLEPWCEQGVLLWNVTPTIGIERDGDKWNTLTHSTWPEWPPLTQEIVERLSAKGGVVFVFFGRRAQDYVRYVDCTPGYNSVIFCTHPSPMAQRWTNRPIAGSRLFTEINRKLLDHHKEPIDWRLE